MGALADAGALIRRHVATGIIGLSAIGAGAIVVHEGMVKTAYVDPVGVVTVCAGHTKTAKLGQVKTDAECAALLQADTAEAQAAVNKGVQVRLTQEQFDALVSFTFNVGSTNFNNSTLLKKINLGKCWEAGAEFSKWDLAKGKRLPGLTKRRAYERKQFESGCRAVPYAQRAQGSILVAYSTTLLVGGIEPGAIWLSAITPTTPRKPNAQPPFWARDRRVVLAS